MTSFPSRARTLAHSLRRYGDVMPQPVTFAGPPSWRGFGMSFVLGSMAIILGILFTYQYFTERVTLDEFTDTQHRPTQFTMACVSHSGCNVSYVFTAGSVCEQFVPPAHKSGKHTFYSENTTFPVMLCFDENLNEDGLVITSTFAINRQYSGRKKTWIAEIAQPGRPQLPLASIHDLQLRVSLLFSSSLVKHLWRRKHLLSMRWSLGNTGNDYRATLCPAPVDIPVGSTCGGYLLKPSIEFKAEVIQLKNGLFSVVSVWMSLLLGALTIAKLFSGVKLRPEQLNVVVDVELEHNNTEAHGTLHTVRFVDDEDAFAAHPGLELQTQPPCVDDA